MMQVCDTMAKIVSAFGPRDTRYMKGAELVPAFPLRGRGGYGWEGGEEMTFSE